ncbi:YqiA/YcfP family alpha/beta fold hydrolase [Chitinilyticum piscinae]|uniref:Esterase n=1 Tax=Chitinilyticum piscinae TaxID=2866724 RepID=A0A8J7FGW3_9NEIS|nr:YqiA/YcfP family alpha/beta fold hydrolase [Chitinilyticum piscinae]MBE9607935.1 esterase [Chitinilyticum piscinae]
MTHLVYLHGLLSSPAAGKARATADWLQQRGLASQFHAPALPTAPHACAALLRDLLAGCDAQATCLIGSSLGGFWATWAVETFGVRAVLLNPAVQPSRLVAAYTGEQRNHHTGECEIILPDYAQQLVDYERRPTRHARYWLLVQTGDETLDYRHAVAWYAGCRQTVLEGGDHGFTGYRDWLPAILDFAHGAAA